MLNTNAEPRYEKLDKIFAKLKIMRVIGRVGIDFLCGDG